ncbi:hypothetical protein L7F22_006635 [Adiantum nelumboides]|nr:hypothetical protein [Adiantum nelumboides]
MEGKRDEPETINVWELMSGLDEDESSPRLTSFPAIPVQKHMAIAPDLAAKLSLDSFTLEPSNESARHPRQPSFPKVDRRYAQRSSVLALEDPVARLPVPSAKFNPVDLPSSSGSSLFGSVSGSNTSSFEALADNLQRSLSFKLVFNNQNKDILGLEDTLFSNASKDEFANNVVEDSAQVRRSSEGNSMPTTTPSNPLFSTSSKLKKWFKVNKGVSKLQNAIRGGSNQESYSKKPPTHTNGLSSRSSGNVIDGFLSKKVSESGSSCKVSESSSSGRGSDDFSELNGESVCITANKSTEVGQGGPVRRYRHSFSSGNQNRGSAEESIPTSMNRPSSWELEKVVTDSGFKAVLFSTNLRTDINAYEDSNAVRAILISLVGAAFDEKSVSQNPEYERELKNALNLPVVAVPTICVRGKYIAGIDNIMQFFKKGILGSLLLETLPHGLKPNSTCLCRGGKFLICPICKGKRTIVRQGEDPVSCRHCIGTGLLKCPGCRN